MAKQLFVPGRVYPSDSYGGSYVELTGKVTQVDSDGWDDDDDISVTVDVPEYGQFNGFALKKHAPSVGYTATIRVYDSGGGWYPDDRIVGWGTT